jgi:hypothetical protein
MMSVLLSLLLTLRGLARSHAALQLEVLACGTNCSCSERGLGGCGSRRGPVALGMAVPHLDRVANGARYRQTGDGDRLAPPRRPVVLDLEEPAAYRSADRAL